MNHRDHQAAFNAKRLSEELDDEEASRIADLLAAAQKQTNERPVYRELVKPGEVNQQGATR
jgi:hypothetical protein